MTVSFCVLMEMFFVCAKIVKRMGKARGFIVPISNSWSEKSGLHTADPRWFGKISEVVGYQVQELNLVWEIQFGLFTERQLTETG
jgi:hypothetical protein